MAIASVFFMFLLPSTPSLSSFGRPDSVESIDSAQQVLYYLQEYNTALVRTIDVTRYFLMFFAFLFLGSFLIFLKTIGDGIHRPEGMSNVDLEWELKMALRKAFTLKKRGQWNEAIEQFEQVIQRSGDHPNAELAREQIQQIRENIDGQEQ